MRIQAAVLLILLSHSVLSAEEKVEIARYLRPAGTGFQPETEIKVERLSDGQRFTSITQRGSNKLTLMSRFDNNGRLKFARVTAGPAEQQTATASNKNGKATVTRDDGQIDQLDCPPGVIVTSAPDWTDTFLLVRRYDRRRAGQQEFSGLWIHPNRKPLFLALKITHHGTDTVTFDGASKKLDRYLIVLRNNSRYVAWGNADGQLVRLVPDNKERPAIVLAGWEAATSQLPASQ